MNLNTKSAYTKSQIVNRLDAHKSSLTMAFANWRSGATLEERRSYNTTDKILLSFDDYTDSIPLHKMLLILEEKQVKAAFFPIGTWAKKYPELIEDIRQRGHWLGNHTMTHKNLLKLSDSEIEDEIKGGVPSTLLRPPYGGYDKRVKMIAKANGYKISNWSIDSYDWKGLTSERIQQRILRNLRPGSCILLHMNAEHTIEALRDLIDNILALKLDLCSKGDELVL